MALAEQNFRRASQLLETRAMAREEYDAIQERLKSAQFSFQVRQKELELLELGTREEQIAEAQAQLAAAKAAWDLTENGYRSEEVKQMEAARDAAGAELKAIQRQIDELAIRSPVDGVVEALELRAGDLVAARAPVMSILDSSQLWVRAYVPENQLDLQLGDKLTITVDSYPGEQFSGVVNFIAREAEFTPSNVQTPEERSKQVFRMKVDLTEGLDRLRPGMAADVHLDQNPSN
jgi:multidrug resistance efflux pump